MVTIHVSGDGYLADLYKSIVKAFTPHGQGTEIDTMLCLPVPVTPDFDKYTQILVLIFLCWLMAFFEPYGLRMRQVVMCQYYPERAKQRAAWLYNYIIRYPISLYPRYLPGELTLTTDGSKSVFFETFEMRNTYFLLIFTSN